jgi:cytochrome c-type biogenesis protein CcmH
MVRSLSRLVAILSLAFVAACSAADDPASRAREIERRILAPCCRRQILEDHDSELARALRAEIAQRSQAGEPAAAIEDDLARRYGEDIRAMPRGRDPRAVLGAIIAAIVGLGALTLVWFMRRRRAAVATAQAAPPGQGADPAYQDRLDDELLAVD